MTYISGTLTDSNAPATLYAEIAAALSANGYSLVDTFVVTTLTYKVWKNPAAANPANLDWYLIIIYTTTGAGYLDFTAAEGWDVASHTALRPIYQVSDYNQPNNAYAYQNSNVSTTVGYDVATASPRGSTLLALQTPAAATVLTGQRTLVAPATSFGYWISVTTEKIAWIHTGAATYLGYVGLYAPDPYYVALDAASGRPSTAGIFPLISARWQANDGSSTYITRQVAGTRFGGFPNHLRLVGTSGLQTEGSWSNIYGISYGHAASMRKTPSGAMTGVYIFEGFNDVPAAAAKATVKFTPLGLDMPLGTLYGIRLLATDSSVARGDTVLIDGLNYALSTSNGGMSHALRMS